MEIKNKLDSIRVIKDLNLNKLAEGIFHQGEEEKVKAFLEKYPYNFYAIRDKKKTGGIFKFNVRREDVLKEIKNYELFTINVSSGNFAEHQILTGDVKVSDRNEIYLVASTDPNASVRDAYIRSDFNLNTDIFDKVLDEVPGFDYLYEFIFNHNLINVIVEFSLFDIPVGIKGENIVIYELRTHYQITLKCIFIVFLTIKLHFYFKKRKNKNQQKLLV